MKKKAHQKTNAARILDRMNIAYDLVDYPVDPDNLAAEHVAELLGEPIERVYKTLTLRGDKNGVFVCVVAGDKEVDLKKAAVVSGNKKVEMLPLKELLPTTGYIRGGCTSIGMKKDYPVFLSEEMMNFEKIYISAGMRGLQIFLSPADLQKASKGTLADIVKDE